MNLNPFSAASWLWKALRGNSVTFAALFSLGVLGLSVTRIVQNALGAMGVPFLGLLIVPVLLIGMIAKKEAQWMPQPEDRKRWSRRLVFGSIGAAVLLALLFPKKREPDSDRAEPSSAPMRHRGPPGK